jgi:hypothetical protein
VSSQTVAEVYERALWVARERHRRLRSILTDQFFDQNKHIDRRTTPTVMTPLYHFVMSKRCESVSNIPRKAAACYRFLCNEILS